MEKIAVTYENGDIFQHFGRSSQFKVYTIENNKILSSEIIGNNGAGHGALVDVLVSHGIKVLICGGIGEGARNMLSEVGIIVYSGASGAADPQVEAFLTGKFVHNDVKCNCEKDNCRHH